METAVHNQLWNIENVKNIPVPTKNPYYSEEMFENIRTVRDEIGKISTLSCGDWYRYLLENNITKIKNEEEERVFLPCRTEKMNPNVDWELSWKLAVQNGLGSEEQSF